LPGMQVATEPLRQKEEGVEVMKRKAQEVSKPIFSLRRIASRVGGQRGAVWGFDLPETFSGGISASPFPTSSLRTVRAGFLAHGSPVKVAIPLSIEQD
jgi:hypothetical protein